MITVIDALMGTGKTSYIFDLMNNNPDKRYIYIGLNLAESERCVEECPSLDFRNPVARHGRKYWDMLQLVKEGKNIASTHQLFKAMSLDLSNAVKAGGYTLIIDESLDVVEQYKVAKNEFAAFLAKGMVYFDDSNILRWNHEYATNEADAKYIVLPALCDNGNLVRTRGEILMWQFPSDFLDAFKEVFILTYMFKGQVMSNYFDANEVKYVHKTLTGKPKERRLISYALGYYQREKRELAEHIKIDAEPRRLEIGNRVRSHPLTYSWYNTRIKKNASHGLVKELDQLRINTEAFFKKYGEGAATNMWTTFKNYKSKVKGARYSNSDCFVAMNTKATDNLKDKAALAFLVDRWQSPIVNGYFQDMGIPIREDLFALTELIQWIFRSRIRKQPAEEIQLYLPSQRMRLILTRWIKYTDAEIVSGKVLYDPKIDGFATPFPVAPKVAAPAPEEAPTAPARTAPHGESQPNG